ncbi:hypothetical protein ACFQVA_41190 [Actinomadura keratinilytica]
MLRAEGLLVLAAEGSDDPAAGALRDRGAQVLTVAPGIASGELAGLLRAAGASSASSPCCRPSPPRSPSSRPQRRRRHGYGP